MYLSRSCNLHSRYWILSDLEVPKCNGQGEGDIWRLRDSPVSRGAVRRKFFQVISNLGRSLTHVSA